MQRYAGGDYKAAMKYFLISARYADKLSQPSIGLMYFNGEGVQKAPVTAFAWIAIAAERKYPKFIATRDRIWSQLDAQQRERARAVIENSIPNMVMRLPRGVWPWYCVGTATSRPVHTSASAAPR